jgi:hypothetical protein
MIILILTISYCILKMFSSNYFGSIDILWVYIPFTYILKWQFLKLMTAICIYNRSWHNFNPLTIGLWHLFFCTFPEMYRYFLPSYIIMSPYLPVLRFISLYINPALIY